MSRTIFPHAVCTDCSWIQIHHAGDLRSSHLHAFDHEQTTGHTTRIKHQHEFTDLLFKRALTLAYGETGKLAWAHEMEHLITHGYASLLDAYDSGCFTLEDCEEQYTCVCEWCEEARQKHPTV